MAQLKQFIITGWPEKKHLNAELRKFYEVREELSVGDNGVFVLRGDRVVPPSNLMKRLLTLLHEGHLEIVKTKQRAK